MTTDNRTNEQLSGNPGQFTDAQVEAAAKAIADCYNPGMFERYPENWRVEARAALVAAQGAAPQVAKDIHEPSHDRVYCVRCGGNWPCQAPQAECDCGAGPGSAVCKKVCATRAPVLPSSATPQAEAYDHCCQHPKCPGGSLCCCASEHRLRDCWNQWREEIAGDSKQAFRDGYQAGQNDPAPWLTTPELPSSGVDEDKLAEVVCFALNHRDGGEECEDDYRVARAVAEWLKGQER